MARIYLDAWGIKRGPHGVARYCRCVVPALVKAAPQHEFFIVGPPRRGAPLVEGGAAHEIELRLPETDWARLLFRPFLESTFKQYGRPDVYHSLFQMLPLGLKDGTHAPRSAVVSLHDLIAIDHADEVKRGALARAWVKTFDPLVIPYALRHADHVICSSEATRQRAADWVPLDRSTTVHLGVSDALLECRCTRASRRFEQFGAYVAAFGVARPYKNAGCIVRALAQVRRVRPDVGLVLVGGDGGVAAEIRDLGLGDAVTVVPQVCDAELAALVAGAAAFVVASRAEGFGLPVLEAMAIGTPVAASDIPVLREIGGDAPEWFDPDDPGQLALILQHVLDDECVRAKMIALGRERARAFNWEKTAKETLAVYDLVMGNG